MPRRCVSPVACTLLVGQTLRRKTMQSRSTYITIGLALVFAIVAGVAAIFVANAQTAGKLNTVDRNLTLWNIQPGLGTVMIEYSIRFDNLWFAADAGNWDMVQ